MVRKDALQATEHKKTVEALRALSARQQALLLAVPDIIMEVDADKVYTWSNQAGFDFFGDDVVGKEASFYFEGEQETYSAVQPLFNGGEETIYLESWQRRKDNQKRLLAWWCRVLKDKDGKASGAISSARDITEQKLAEVEVIRLNAELERRVHERTMQLELANRELEAFSYSVSHDLRAPLRSIDGFSQALIEDYIDKPLDETARDYLQRVRRATQRMGLLIEDLLKLSRINKVEIKQETVDLSAMVRKVAEACRSDSPNKVVDLAIREGITVEGDPYLMKIAMDNLLSNAFKFTGRTAAPRIEFGSFVKDGVKGCFIRDNGAGFDMVYADKLFGAFQRLHTADEFPGTGIGLATVQRIIHRHGGKIWAEAAKSQGATFYFTLPHLMIG